MKLLLIRFASGFALLGLLVLGFGAVGCGGSERYKFEPLGEEAGRVGPGTESTETSSTRPAGLFSDTLGPDTLGTGDRIMLVFSGNPNAPQTPHTEQIREDGHITPPLLGVDVLAAGKTIGQLQAELRNLYVPAFFSSVTITVRSEERYFSVGGQVNRPGQIMYRADMTVLKAVQAAGDFTDFANRRRVLLTRKDGTLMEVDVRRALRDTRYDPPVYPGDIIHVQQRW
jgi:polysaccharide biosynthesis/export protein VpsN